MKSPLEPRLTSLLRLGVVSAAVAAFPVLSAAETPRADESSGHSGFAEFPPLEAGELDGVPELELSIAMADGDMELEVPDTPVELRLRIDETTRYRLASELRIDYDHRSDFQIDYRSGAEVTYRPADAAESMIVEITSHERSFRSPAVFDDGPHTHSLLRDAALRVRIDERGNVSEVTPKAPTNPILRPTADELARLAAATRPTFPDGPVEPGDRWEDTVDIDVEEDKNHRAQSVTLSYEFADWTPCRSSVCARINIDADISVRGKQGGMHLDTHGESSGTAEGRMLFDVDAGRVVASTWDYDVAGRTTTRRRDDDGEPTIDYGFRLRTATAFELIEP